MVTPDDLERERYEARLKMRRDITAALAYAYEQGFQEAFGRSPEEIVDKRFQERRRIGLLVIKIRLYQRLLRRAETPEEQLRALPLDELICLTQQLEIELFGIPSQSP